MGFEIKEIATKPFDGQKPGTSGLRKRYERWHPLVYASSPYNPTGSKCSNKRYLQSSIAKCIYEWPCQHYTENFIQAIFDSIKAEGSTLVIGGDGRFFSPETVQTILRIGSANNVAKFIIGKDSILSTPAASNVIRKYKADGGILLTASHNPGGPNADFGIKYNVSNGGPAPEGVTNKIYEKTKTITKYKVIESTPVSLIFIS
jgi:phosphoglucomutase